jgi:hypothetical protein
MGPPLVMKGSIFFNKTLQSPSGEWIEHVGTLFGVKQGIWNFGISWAGPPIRETCEKTMFTPSNPIKATNPIVTA